MNNEKPKNKVNVEPLQRSVPPCPAYSKGLSRDSIAHFPVVVVAFLSFLVGAVEFLFAQRKPQAYD